MIQWAVSAGRNEFGLPRGHPLITGTIIGTFPVSVLYIHFGAKYTFFAAGLISAFATLSIPYLAYWNFLGLLAARFFQVQSGSWHPL